MTKTRFAFSAVCVAGLAYYLASRQPVLTPEQVSERMPAPPIAAEVAAPVPVPVVEAKPLQIRPLPSRGQPHIEPGDERAVVKHDIKFLENLRRIPEAAPLVDEIVEYLKNDSNDEFSLNNIPADKNGVAVVDEHTNEHMVANEAVRAKWTKLMELVAAHPEALRPTQNRE